VKRPLAALGLSVAILIAHELLLHVAARAHLGAALLAGHGSLLLGAALLVTRFVAIVVVPGLLLGALAVIAATLRQRDGSSSGAGISVGAAEGASIGVRGTK
jgi:hypothetical protein